MAVSETQLVQMRVGEWESRTTVEMCDQDTVATVTSMAVARDATGDSWYDRMHVSVW